MSINVISLNLMSLNRNCTVDGLDTWRGADNLSNISIPYVKYLKVMATLLTYFSLSTKIAFNAQCSWAKKSSNV